MQTVLVTVSLFIATIFCGYAQTPYEQGMQKALTAWSEGNPTQAAQIFERIAAVEKDNWLPPYYAAMITTINSYSQMDAQKRDAELARAKEFLDSAKGLSANNPEILLIEAQWYTSWIAFDGEKYGMQYAPKVSQIYAEALAIAPNNPRVAFGAVEWEMGSARYFGADVAPYCEKLQKAILLYDTYTNEQPFYPMHGKEYSERVIKENCN